MSSHKLELGMNYLGFFLKPNGYLISDWNWLVQKFERKILVWYNIRLSMGGRLVLIRSVLANLPVYWLTLARVHVHVHNRICSIIFNFLWSVGSESSGTHLVAWDQLALPRSCGGWGIRNPLWVAQDIHLKSLWRALTHSDFWRCIMREKYLKGSTIIDWVCLPRKTTVGVSIC